MYAAELSFCLMPMPAHDGMNKAKTERQVCVHAFFPAEA